MDLCVEKEDCVVTKWIIDVAHMYVEAMKDCAGETWWRWSICGGLKLTKEVKIIEDIWWRMLVDGGLDPMKEKKRGESHWQKRTT